MARSILGRLTYANVTATLALFIALGGASYAAVSIPKNSVGTAQLKAHAVTAAKVAKHTLTGTQINVSKLGTVPSAKKATSAKTATTASTADTAKTATTASDADALGGLAAGSFYQAVGSSHNNLVTVDGGKTQVLGSIAGWGLLSATCDSTCASPTLTYTNTSAQTEAVDFYTCSGSNDYGQETVPAGSAVSGITVGDGGGYDATGACEFGISLWSAYTKTQADFYGGAVIQPLGADDSAFSTEVESYS